MKSSFNVFISLIPVWVRVLILLLFSISVFFAFVSCSKFAKYYPQDNVVEEIVEEVIEEKTGVDVDLSPNTPEKK